MNTGLILNEKADAYHGGDAISSTRLGDMRIAGQVCPLNFYVHHVAKTVPKPDADHFRVGTASHLAILEGPAIYNEQTLVQPETYKNEKGEIKPWHNGANVCKAWHAGAAGKIVLASEEHALISTMAEAVYNHDEARALTARGQAEVTFRKQIAGLVLQCRVDKWHADSSTIVDLKTCDTLERFERDFCFLRYFMRASFYQLVVAEVLADIAGCPVAEIETPDFKFVVVEKSAPHRVKVYTPDAESLDAGRREVHADLTTLRECMASGVWPTGCEGVHSIGLKTWQLAKSIEASDAVLAN